MKQKQWKAVMIRRSSCKSSAKKEINEAQNIWGGFVEHLGLEFF